MYKRQVLWASGALPATLEEDFRQTSPATQEWHRLLNDAHDYWIGHRQWFTTAAAAKHAAEEVDYTQVWQERGWPQIADDQDTLTNHSHETTAALEREVSSGPFVSLEASDVWRLKNVCVAVGGGGRHTNGLSGGVPAAAVTYTTQCMLLSLIHI